MSHASHGREGVSQKRYFMKIGAHAIDTGKVQGVFHRTETIAKARRLNITGCVGNLPDVHVETVCTCLVPGSRRIGGHSRSDIVPEAFAVEWS